MVEGRAVNEGSVSRQLWLEGRPAIAEELEVMRAAMLAEETGARVHICHISTAKAVDIVRRMKEHGVQVWLVNTGWSGGAYGTGERMKLRYTRAMVSAARAGDAVQALSAMDAHRVLCAHRQGRYGVGGFPLRPEACG